MLSPRNRTRRWRSSLRAALVLPAAVALVGCGAAPSTSGAADAASRFAAAVGEGDGNAACALLTPRARDAVTGATDEECEDVITTLGGSDSSAIDVQVWGDAAQAAVGDDVLFLLRYDSGWLVDAAGCVAAADGRYDCAVEG